MSAAGDREDITVIESAPREKWRGATTFFGNEQPYGTTEERDLALNSYCNPCAPFLVSSAGRYVWSDRPFAFSFNDGVLTIRSKYGRVEPVQAGTTLKEAFLAASQRHFPPSGRLPDPLFFAKPQFNTWIESCAVGNSQAFVEGYIDGIPTHLKLHQGDTVVTSSYSYIFPENLMAGTVMELDPSPSGTLNRARIRFSTDFSSLKNVYVIHHTNKAELDALTKNQLKQ